MINVDKETLKGSKIFVCLPVVGKTKQVQNNYPLAVVRTGELFQNRVGKKYPEKFLCEIKMRPSNGLLPVNPRKNLIFLHKDR